MAYSLNNGQIVQIGILDGKKVSGTPSTHWVNTEGYRFTAFTSDLDSIETGYEHETITGGEIISGNNSIKKLSDTVNKVQSAISLAKGITTGDVLEVPTFVPTYNNVQLWKRSVPHGGDITLKFFYGQGAEELANCTNLVNNWTEAKNYSGKFEVVVPILSMFKKFCMVTSTDSTNIGLKTQNLIIGESVKSVEDFQKMTRDEREDWYFTLDRWKHVYIGDKELFSWYFNGEEKIDNIPWKKYVNGSNKEEDLSFEPLSEKADSMLYGKKVDWVWETNNKITSGNSIYKHYLNWVKAQNDAITKSNEVADKYKNRTVSNAYIGPGPSMSTANAAVASKLISDTKSDLNTIASSIKSDKGTVTDKTREVAEKVAKSVYSSYDTAVSDLFGYTKLIIIKVGETYLGPFSVEQVTYGFDFNKVDSEGYPCEGKITFSGLKNVLVPDPNWQYDSSAYTIPAATANS